MPTPVPPTLEGVYRFSSAGIQAAIDRALLIVPEGRRGALVVFKAPDRPGLGMTVAARTDDGRWTVMTDVVVTYHGKLDADVLAAVKRVW